MPARIHIVDSTSLQGLYEFHILKSVRDRYEFDEKLFTTNGNVIFADFHSVRVFTQKINDTRERKISPATINAMGLIDEIFHVIVRNYEERENPNVFARAVVQMKQSCGDEKFSNIIRTFSELFPPLDVYNGKLSIDEYLARSTKGKPHLESTVEEIILLYFANINPAFAPYKELFDDSGLEQRSKYRAMISALERFFQTEKPFGPENQFLFDVLRAPILASPDSLEGQLEFIRSRWGRLLSGAYMNKIYGTKDFFSEEHKTIVHGVGEPPLIVPHYSSLLKNQHEQFEAERYSKDVDWMPRVVLLAKNTFVWLDQLSKKYQRSITALDQIPDEELDQLARWNFTGLWLIGIWQRSPASQKIKQMMGNPEAVSSAYSLYDYEIARELGGEEAFHNLSHRAWQRGIRLAGDMVPNHVGLYSKWVVEHPDYFVQSRHTPFPNYKFSGPNLSEHPNIHVRIEDGYWNKSDAAVAFQRVDTSTGDVRYIYHGNDGTHMPWNDTAQLDFLKQEVREAVIQAIFHVAQKFSIIRFDAAMTLAKKHVQRLWYPQPGTGGDIPSRADYAMTREAFDALFPNEFWREVVDRINKEKPGTLLLAEAFWLLEGYFVRTLGMHRVYNSAFMHMLMKEENAKYRELIKNTLAYDPEILKRYVNFMSNPDERTAVDQFGKDGKYFGVAMLMVTLPGLPMFGHGQIEGYTEKYGMEYKRAYYNESPDQQLVQRHEREVFPVMNKRYLFSQVSDFEFYDVHDAHGHVNEHVFAYSNRNGDERALFFYHNRFAECNVWIKQSCMKAVSVNGSPEKQMKATFVAEALSLKPGNGIYYMFREHRTNLEHIRSANELHEHGFSIGLKAFEYALFTNFTEVYDASGEYGNLHRHLGGNGVPDIRQALKDLKLSSLHHELSELIHSGIKALKTKHTPDFDSILNNYSDICKHIEALGWEANQLHQQKVYIRQQLLAFHVITQHIASDTTSVFAGKLKNEDPNIVFLLWLFGKSFYSGSRQQMTNDELQFTSVVRSVCEEYRLSPEAVNLVDALLLSDQHISSLKRKEIFDAVSFLIEDQNIRQYLLVNEHQGVLYYNKEQMEKLVSYVLLIAMSEEIIDKYIEPENIMRETSAVAGLLFDLSDKALYNVVALKESIKEYSKLQSAMNTQRP